MHAALLLVTLAPIAPQDWPQFLGPERTGKAVLEDTDFAWPEEGPEILWRLEIGPGYGGAAVQGGEVFVLDRDTGTGDVLRVLDLESGELLWDAFYEAPGRLNFPGSRSVPTVTKRYVVTCGGMGQVICWDREAQADVWMRSLEDDYGGFLPDYGWSCSPLLVDDMVVLTALGEDVGLVALELETGDERWVTEPVGISHSTPVLLDLLGQPQIVFVSIDRATSTGNLDQAGELVISSFSPEDGTVLWQTKTEGTPYPIPGPVQVDEDRFFVTGGYRGGSAMLRISEGEDGYAFERLFYTQRGAQIHNPIVHDGHLYFLANENWNDSARMQQEGGLTCLTLDGEEVWRTGANPYFGRGNAILAGEHLLLQDGRNGTLRVVRATPEGYREVASANIFGIDDRRDHQMWGALALSGRRLLMRSQEELLCVQL